LLDNLWTGLGALEKYQAKYSRWGRRRTKKAGNDYQGIERDESVLQNDISNLGTVGVGMLVCWYGGHYSLFMAISRSQIVGVCPLVSSWTARTCIS
jgi:hypothetical protein